MFLIRSTKWMGSPILVHLFLLQPHSTNKTASLVRHESLRWLKGDLKIILFYRGGFSIFFRQRGSSCNSWLWVTFIQPSNYILKDYFSRFSQIWILYNCSENMFVIVLIHFDIVHSVLLEAKVYPWLDKDNVWQLDWYQRLIETTFSCLLRIDIVVIGPQLDCQTTCIRNSLFHISMASQRRQKKKISRVYW